MPKLPIEMSPLKNSSRRSFMLKPFHKRMNYRRLMHG